MRKGELTLHSKHLIDPEMSWSNFSSLNLHRTGLCPFQNELEEHAYSVF